MEEKAKINGKQGAFACTSGMSHQQGLTKREYFAGLAISAGKSAKECVSLADELLKELENE